MGSGSGDEDGERFYSISEYPARGEARQATTPKAPRTPISPRSPIHTIMNALVEDEQEIAKFASVLAKYAGPFIILWILVMAVIFWLLEKDAEGSTVTNYQDALYWTVVTMTTVGFGDMYPTTSGGKVFTIFYILGSLCFISTCAGELFAKLADAAKKDYDDEENRFRSKVWSTENLKQFAAAFITIFIFSLVGALVVYFNEKGFTFLDSLYWSVVTCSTVGFGDMAIKKSSTRVFLVFYIFVGVACYGWALQKIAAIFMEVEQEKKLEAFVQRGVTTAMITEMDQDVYATGKDGKRVLLQKATGEVDKLEFLEYMLVSLNKCTKRDIRLLLKMFADLDESGDGKISIDDIKVPFASPHGTVRFRLPKSSNSADCAQVDIDAIQEKPHSSECNMAELQGIMPMFCPNPSRTILSSAAAKRAQTDRVV